MEREHIYILRGLIPAPDRVRGEFDRSVRIYLFVRRWSRTHSYFHPFWINDKLSFSFFLNQLIQHLWVTEKHSCAFHFGAHTLRRNAHAVCFTLKDADLKPPTHQHQVHLNASIIKAKKSGKSWAGTTSASQPCRRYNTNATRRGNVEGAFTGTERRRALPSYLEQLLGAQAPIGPGSPAWRTFSPSWNQRALLHFSVHFYPLQTRRKTHKENKTPPSTNEGNKKLPPPRQDPLMESQTNDVKV